MSAEKRFAQLEINAAAIKYEKLLEFFSEMQIMDMYARRHPEQLELMKRASDLVWSRRLAKKLQEIGVLQERIFKDN